MDHSMAQPRVKSGPWELPQWKTALSIVSAVLLAFVFLVSGTWKITDPLGAATKMTQALVPVPLSIPAALVFGVSEAFAGVLLLVPRFRRWGAVVSGILLLAFLAYFAFNYSALRGADCSCFPWLKRVVGPGFFISDGVMLLAALAAGLWARPSQGRRAALIILGAVAVFAGASYGVTVARETGIRAPSEISVNGHPMSLQQGRVFLFFYDPMCMHCDHAARVMAKHRWKDVKLVAIPTAMPQYAQQFVDDTGFPAVTSTDVEKLRSVFKFGDPPFAVALEYGHQKAALREFDDKEPAQTLRQLGYIE